MNKEQLIALGLTEEQADKVVEGYGITIPKSRFDEKNEELKGLKDQIKDYDTQLSDLQSKAAGNEALQGEITKLQDANKQAVADYETKLQEQSYTFALDSALNGAKVKNVKAVKALLESEKIKLDGETLTGLQEQLEALKTSDSYLFEEVSDPGKPNPTFSAGTHQTGAIGEPTDLASALEQHYTKQ
jgi:vacuolar-type H+-ATPase subunit I/STV1